MTMVKHLSNLICTKYDEVGTKMFITYRWHVTCQSLCHFFYKFQSHNYTDTGSLSSKSKTFVYYHFYLLLIMIKTILSDNCMRSQG